MIKTTKKTNLEARIAKLESKLTKKNESSFSDFIDAKDLQKIRSIVKGLCREPWEGLEQVLKNAQAIEEQHEDADYDDYDYDAYNEALRNREAIEKAFEHLKDCVDILTQRFNL